MQPIPRMLPVALIVSIAVSAIPQALAQCGGYPEVEPPIPASPYPLSACSTGQTDRSDNSLRGSISELGEEGFPGQAAASGTGVSSKRPIDEIHLYLCAFHVAKENPTFQIEAHHYCGAQGGDVHQCVIYDSLGPNAKLLGIEYLIDDETYRTLPEEEKQYWHPHAYEILSGQLVAPDLPDQGDKALSGLLATWGKTWHTWRDPRTVLPIGEPLLMWSANGDGQIDTKLIEKRDEQFGISTAGIRHRRQSLGFAVPRIPPPRSIREPGRQWTPTDPDEPTRIGQQNPETSTGRPQIGTPKPSQNVYTCPMHPEVNQPSPGKCPKCGMDLVRK